MPVKKVNKLAVDPKQTQALLAAVLADPADDNARSVLADHLTSAGDPRGELIAVQLELARRGDKTEKQDPKTKPLWARFRELHSRYSGTWMKPIKALGKPTKWTLHRGFVRSLQINDYDARPDLLAPVLAVEPVVDLAILTNDGKRLATYLDLPGIERVRRLIVVGYSNTAGNGDFIPKALAKAKRIAGVTELRVGLQFQDAGLAALGSAATLPALTRLCLGSAEPSPAGALRFLASPVVKRLTRLEWCRSDVTVPIAAAVVKLPKLEYFMASVNSYIETESVLEQRFAAKFIEEDDGGDDYLFTST